MEGTRKKVAVGLAQIDRGEVVSSDVVMARLQEKIMEYILSVGASQDIESLFLDLDQ